MQRIEDLAGHGASLIPEAGGSPSADASGDVAFLSSTRDCAPAVPGPVVMLDAYRSARQAGMSKLAAYRTARAMASRQWIALGEEEF